MSNAPRRGPGRPRTKVPEAKEGSKSLRRALRLLRAMTARDADGAKLSELAQAAGVHRATAHRLLSALQDEGMVSLDPDTRIYNLGFEILRIAGSAKHIATSSHLRGALEEIARELGEDVYLVMPAGNDGIVVDKVEGELPVRLVSPAIGSRRPLGVGACAIAILSIHTPEACRRIYEANLPRYDGIPWISAEQIWEEIIASRKRGFTVVKGHMLAEATGVAVAFRDASGVPAAAVGVTATTSRMLPERRAQVAETIRRHVEAIGPLPQTG
jgi:DNA-binding IclR family transcriptional regulator